MRGAAESDVLLGNGAGFRSASGFELLQDAAVSMGATARAQFAKAVRARILLLTVPRGDLLRR